MKGGKDEVWEHLWQGPVGMGDRRMVVGVAARLGGPVSPPPFPP